MMEYLAWPAAFLLLGIFFLVLFRSQIADLIKRTRRVGRGGIDVDPEGAGSSAKQQTVEASPAKEAPPVPTGVALPPPDDALAPIEHQLRAALDAAGSMTADVKLAWLIRDTAIARMQRAHEIVYRLIFGSQLDLLLVANTASPPDMNRAKIIYDQARANFSEIYGDSFSFEDWIRFPVATGLLSREPQLNGSAILRTTAIGRDFMHYLITNGLTSRKGG